MSRSWRWILLAVGVLALNVFWVGPFVSRLWGDSAGNVAYILVRIAVIPILTFGLTTYCSKSRFQALSAGAFVVFLDHVALKTLILYQDFRAHPENWVQGGEPVPFGTVVFGIFASFMIFVPFILLLGAIGTELPHLIKLFKHPGADRSSQ